MAKQAGDIKLIGRFDDLCFYEMEGRYYVRTKSSLSGKRFRKDAAFEGSRKSASRFGTGNRLASQVYRLVAKEKRVYPLFCFLKRRSILLLKDGEDIATVREILIDYLVTFGLVPGVKPKAAPRKMKKAADNVVATGRTALPFVVPTKEQTIRLHFGHVKVEGVRDG